MTLKNYTFGDNLKKLRERNNLKQKDLAYLLNVSIQSIKSWEAGTIPKGEHLIIIAKKFNLSIDDLLGVNFSKQVKVNELPDPVDKAIQEFRKELEKYFCNEKK